MQHDFTLQSNNFRTQNKPLKITTSRLLLVADVIDRDRDHHKEVALLILDVEQTRSRIQESSRQTKYIFLK